MGRFFNTIIDVWLIHMLINPTLVLYMDWVDKATRKPTKDSRYLQGVGENVMSYVIAYNGLF